MRYARPKVTLALVALVSTIILANLVGWGCAKKLVPPPQSKIEVVVDTLHGVAVEDSYRWLEDQESEATRSWIESQNAYTQDYMATVTGKEKIAARTAEMLKVDYSSMPTERNGRYFLYKRAADQDQKIIYVRDGLEGEDRVLVDPHPLDTAHTTSVGVMAYSTDGSLLAYSIRLGGAEEEEVHFLNVDTGEELTDILPTANYFGISIEPSKNGFYYSHYVDTVGTRIYYHKFGTPFSDDDLIFGEGDGPESISSPSLTDDGRFLLVTVYHGSSGSRNEIYFKDLKKRGRFKTLVADIDAKFYPDLAGSRVFMQTNWEAPNWRVIVADLKKPAQKYWKEIVPAGDNPIEDISVIGGKIFVKYLENVQSRVKIFEADGTYLNDLKLPTMGSVISLRGSWTGTEAFFNFTSYTYPTTIFRYDITTGEQKVWYKRNIPIDADAFEVHQEWFTSKDGTKVPMFMVHKKGLALDGNNPTLIYGYGGFNNNETPYFSRRAVLWVEAGGVYCDVALRGGGEFGEEWHKAAMFEKKQNTFDDLYAAAEWLIENKYTNPAKIGVAGGSNGGLLVGAALTQRPDLFGAILCTYPLLDMLRFHMFLMGPFWTSEYGSADDPEGFEYISKYSPYQNVKAGTPYPAVLFVTGDADTRVDPMHARKMTALVQAATASDKPVLLYYDTKAGHMGGKPIRQIVEDYVVEVGFLFDQLGVN